MPSGAESKIREAIELALKHQAEGRLRAAGSIYRRVLRVEPENPDALHFLGVIAHKVGRPDLAMELLARSIAADPHRVGFRLNLGSLYLKQQQVDEAIACYRDAIALEPTSASAYAHLAGALARQGKLEAANEAYDRATELKALPPHAIQPQVEPAGPAPAQPSPGTAEAAFLEADVSQAEPGLAETPGATDEPLPEAEDDLCCAQGDGLTPPGEASAGDDPHPSACTHVLGETLNEESPLSASEETASASSEQDLGCAESLGILSVAGAPSASSGQALTGGFAAPASLPPARACPELAEGAPAALESFPSSAGDGLTPSVDPIVEPTSAAEPLEQPAAPPAAEVVFAGPLDFVIPAKVEGGDAGPAALPEPLPPPSVDFVIPLEPQAAAVTASGGLADHAARAALALQYAWALHFGPAHSVPSLAGRIFGVDDGQSPLDQELFALPKAGSTDQTAGIADEGIAHDPSIVDVAAATSTVDAASEVAIAGPAPQPNGSGDDELIRNDVDSFSSAAGALTGGNSDPPEPPAGAPAAPEVPSLDASPAGTVHELAAPDATAPPSEAGFWPEGHMLPLPDPDPVGLEPAAEAVALDDGVERGAWLEASAPTLLPPPPLTTFDEACYVDLGLPDNPAEPLAEEPERVNGENAELERAVPGEFAASGAFEDEADAAGAACSSNEPFELDDDAPLMASPGLTDLAGESREGLDLLPGAPASGANGDDTVSRFAGGELLVVPDSGPRPASGAAKQDGADKPAAGGFDTLTAGGLGAGEPADPDAASGPAPLLAGATHAGEAVEAVHIPPGLLGEAHAQVLSGRFEPSAGVAPGVDRSAETLPLPGTPGLRSLRGTGAPVPSGRGRPPSAESLRRRGVALIGFRRLDEAIHLLNQAVALRPTFAEAHRDLGGAMLRQGNLEGAIASLQRALKLRPTFAEAWGSLGDAYQLEGKISQAIRCYRRLLELVPRAAKVHSNMLLSMNYDPQFTANELFQEHLRWAERHAEQHLGDIQPHSNDRTPNRRLMIGYVSPDFRRHSVNYFAEPILSGHYRPDFHVTCYSDVVRPDGVTRGLADLSDDFRDTHAMNDEQLAAQVRADGIDILVDLSGHTGNNRLGTFARKPAPIQVTYLGYPNTTGLPTIDYRITDALADPPGQTERFHSEQLVRLPETFLCYQPPHGSPDVGPLPCLKAGHVTFGCFNILAKITDEVMALWARVLQELPDSRLILKGRSNALSAENRREHVREIFVNHGISPDRLELLGKEPSYAQHLSHYRRLDIVLDPFPYNGTTTTCEALWMGLPVVTLAGDRHVSRVGVSILSNVNLPELIASTPEQYVQIATSLADSPKNLSRLRSTLRDRMHRSPLTDSVRVTRALEAEYRSMWVHWCQTDPSAPRDTLMLTDG